VSDKNRDKYYAFAVGIMLTTDSGLRTDFRSLSNELRTAENLRNLIRHNLYFPESGVRNGRLALKQTPTPPNQPLEDVVRQLNTQIIVDNWEALNQASDAVNHTLRLLLDYDQGGSCPGYFEQPTLFQKMGETGANIPDDYPYPGPGRERK
jgi:hypothetical protein